MERRVYPSRDTGTNSRLVVLRGAVIYLGYTVTNEPLQSPLRPTVDVARLAEFIADANSRVSAIRDHRWELPRGARSLDIHLLDPIDPHRRYLSGSPWTFD